MPTIHKWVDTHGGPFILVAESLLPSWRGTEGWSYETHGDDDSDYSKACDVIDWIERIGCGEGEAYVLGGDIGSVSWITDDGLVGGYIVQWIGIDDESSILPALQSDDLRAQLTGDDAERKFLEVADPGKLSEARTLGFVPKTLVFDTVPEVRCADLATFRCTVSNDCFAKS